MVKESIKINTHTPKVTVTRRCRACGSGLPEGWKDIYCELCEDRYEMPIIDMEKFYDE